MRRLAVILLALAAAALMVFVRPSLGGGKDHVASAGAQPAPRLRIIATNDFHGALEPSRDGKGASQGGADAMASEIDRARRTCPQPCVTLLLDGGDLFQGTAASSIAHGRPVVDLYNALGYAAAAVGNHEFDWGLDTLRARMSEAHFSMLAANVRYRNGRDVEWIPNDTVVERGPYRIGIIGAIGPETYGSIMASNVATLRFSDPVPIVDSITRVLRSRGADVVVVVIHSGAFCKQHGTRSCGGDIIDFARRLGEGVDAIVSGHTHSVVDFKVRGVPIVQARSSGKAVAVVDLAPRARAAGGEVLSEEVEDVVAGALPVLPRVDSIVRSSSARVAPLVNREVARLATAMPRRGSDYPLGNLIADAQRWAGQSDLALVNDGGIRTGLHAGSVSYGELFQLQPFGNPLRKLTVSGSAVRAYLEGLVARGQPRTHVSGAVITYNSTLPRGRRIVSVVLDNGDTLRDDGRYTLVLNEYMATGRSARKLVTGATANQRLGPSDLDALVAYLESRSQPVRPPVGRRFTTASKR
ncbi:MAG TPA: 5'-nucleotidase C-terminal domain-containing protein [Gemmatimonadaceae bacterium]